MMGAGRLLLFVSFAAFVCLTLFGGVDAVKSAAADRRNSVSTSASSYGKKAHLALHVRSFVRPPLLVGRDSQSETLRSYAARIGLYIGSMEDSNPGNGWENSWVRNTLASEFNLIVPGTQFKWSTIHPTQDAFDFGPADSLVDFAVAHNMKVRGHNLLWGMSNPRWLGNGPARTYTKFTGRQLETILVNHIRTVMGHYREEYPGVVKWWDVTNEVMGWNNKFNSDGILWSKIGGNPDRADYLRIAFQTARAADPDAVLCMNDWGNEGSIPSRTENMIETVKALRAEGVPIDCVGMEAHLGSESPPTYERVLKVMRAYADMGVQVQITEFDIRVPRAGFDWKKASTIAANILKACIDSPNCTAFNNWGFSQAYYINDSGNPNLVTVLPWNSQNEKSPEYAAMLALLKSEVKKRR